MKDNGHNECMRYFKIFFGTVFVIMAMGMAIITGESIVYNHLQSRGVEAHPPDTVYITVTDTVYIDKNEYERSLYGGWIDADRDCQNTRHEVLIVESTVPVTLDSTGCRVIKGRWEDPYTGGIFTNPSVLDVDHFIPLSEAHQSGADRWSREERRAFANNLDIADALIAVSASANRSKGNRDPSQWLPPNEGYHCQYIKMWVALKQHYGLSMDTREREFINNHPCMQQ